MKSARKAQPHRIISRELRARHMLASDLAVTLRITLGEVNDLVDGVTPITEDLALGLATAFGTSEEFWMSFVA